MGMSSIDRNNDKAGIDYSLEALAPYKSKLDDAGGAGRIYSVRMPNGTVLWVKEALGRKYTLKRVIGGGLVDVFGRHSMFRTRYYTKPEDGLRLEATRLRQFAQKGVNVPAVLHESSRHLVLESCGIGAHLVFAVSNKSEADDLGFAIMRTLNGLHENGMAHGDAIVKNFTVRNGRVGIIDLEGAPELESGVHSFAARDVWGLLYSLSRGYAGERFTLHDVQARLLKGYLSDLKPDTREKVSKDLNFMAHSVRGVFASAIKGVRVHNTLKWHQMTKQSVLSVV